MNYKAAYRRIAPESCRGDVSAFLARLYEPWPGMDDDIQLAKGILYRHMLTGGKKGVPLAGTLSQDGNELTVADWRIEVIEAFDDKYPDVDERMFRTMKAMAAIDNEIIPPEPN